jgi:hypothetical protein
LKQYRTTALTEFFSGRIGLTDAQAAARARNLRPIADGVFEITGPLQFKAGETITLEEVDKMVLGRLEILTEEKKAKRKK